MTFRSFNETQEKLMKKALPVRKSLPLHSRNYTVPVPSWPYVGINAPMTVHEVLSVGSLYLDHRDSVPVEMAQPFLGLMVSYEGLRGLEQDPGRAKHYPDIDRIPELIDAARNIGMKCIIHYNTQNPHICEELEALEKRWGRIPDGWQLNVVWPDPRELNRYLAAVQHARVQFIVQIGSRAFHKVGNNPEFMARRLTDYDGLASYYLFDLSGGEGKVLDVEASRPVLEAMYRYVGCTLSVAGGLGPETVRLIKQLLKDFPFLSWDAQRAVRDENDEFDLKRVEGFLDASYTLVRTRCAELPRVQRPSSADT